MVTLSGSSSIVRGDALLPVVVRLAEHAGNQIDVDLREAERARLIVGAADLGRAMRAAVQLEQPIVEVLDAEAQPRDAGLRE